MASLPAVNMPRRKKNARNQAAESDQHGASSEVSTGGESAASQPTAPSAEAGAQLGDESRAVPTAGGLVNAGGVGAVDRAELALTDDAETRSRRAFFGRSGQLAVMSEFLYRRINVAIPEVDVGDDVFVVKGGDDTVTRVQVKAATAKAQAGSYFALFNVPLAQLSLFRDTPALVYVFAARFQDRWSDFVVIRRSTLLARFNEGAGARRTPPDAQEYVQFRIVFTADSAQCGPVNLQRYRNAWDPWPPLQPEEEETPPENALPSANLGEPPQPPDGPAPAATASG